MYLLWSHDGLSQNTPTFPKSFRFQSKKRAGKKAGGTNVCNRICFARAKGKVQKLEEGNGGVIGIVLTPHQQPKERNNVFRIKYVPIRRQFPTRELLKNPLSPCCRPKLQLIRNEKASAVFIQATKNPLQIGYWSSSDWGKPGGGKTRLKVFTCKVVDPARFRLEMEVWNFVEGSKLIPSQRSVKQTTVGFIIIGKCSPSS